METEVVFLPAAERDLNRLDRQVARRVLTAVQRYAAMGGGNVRRLTAAGGELRLRVGDWRVRFVERTEERAPEPPASDPIRVRVIEVRRVLHRGAAYQDR